MMKYSARSYSLLFALLYVSAMLLFPLATYADGGAPNLAYVIGGGSGISIIDIAQQKVTGGIHLAGHPHYVFLSLDGRFLYVAQPSLNRVTMLSAKTGQTLCTANLPGQPSLLAYDQGVNLLYAAGNGSSQISVLDPANCAVKRQLQNNGPVYGLAVAVVGQGAAGGNGNQLWVSGPNSVSIYDSSGKQLQDIPVAGGPQYITIPPGTTIYVTVRQGGIDAIDISSYKVVPLLSGGAFGPMDYDAGTGDVYAPNQQNNTLDVLTPLSSSSAPLPQEPNHIYQLGAAPQSVAITSDGQVGFVALAGGNVAMLDVPGRQMFTTIHVGGDPHFIITGLYPPLVGTTPQQAAQWGTIITVVAYGLVAALLIVPILLFWRYRRPTLEAQQKESKKI